MSWLWMGRIRVVGGPNWNRETAPAKSLPRVWQGLQESPLTVRAQLPAVRVNPLPNIGSRTEERRWDHRHSIRSTVRIGARRDDDGVEEVGADPFLEPPQVPHVTVTNGGGELDLDG